MSRKGLVFLSAFVVGVTGVTADVVTNVWRTAQGGDWCEPANWEGGHLPADGCVADFRSLASGAGVTASAAPGVTVSELLFSGAADDNWTFAVTGAVFSVFNVAGGTLNYTAATGSAAAGRLSKTGSGTLLFDCGNFQNGDQWFRLRVEEGALRLGGNNYTHTLANARLSLCGGTRLVCPNNASGTILVGALDSPDDAGTIELNGCTLNPVRHDNARLVETFTGPGTILASLNTVDLFTPPAAGVNLCAYDGQVVVGESPVGWWRFEDADMPGRDSGLLGNNLRVAGNGSVRIVTDSERGNVAQFNGTGGLVGGGDNAAILNLPVGSPSYTIALWMKMTATENVNDAFVFWGNIAVAECVFFKIWGDNGTPYFSQGGEFSLGKDDSLGLNEALNNGAWHHLAATFDNSTARFYLDGTCLKSKPWTGTFDIKAKDFRVGMKYEGNCNNFTGLMDDVCLFARALDVDEIANLRDGTLPAPAAQGPALDSGVTIRGGLNGEMRLATSQRVAAVEGGGPRARVRVESGATLTVGASANAPARAVFHGGFTGGGAVVKDGADTALTLDGRSTHTGGTAVNGGTLTLARPRTPGCRYSFDDSAAPGADANVTADLGTFTGTWTDDPERGGVVTFNGQQTLHSNAAPMDGVLAGNPDYTIALWFKAATDCSNDGNFFWYGSQVSAKSIQFRFINNHHTLCLAHFNGTGDFTAIAVPDGRNLNDNHWHHLAATRADGKLFKVYLDGAKIWETTCAFTMWLPEQSRLSIGSYDGGAKSERYFKGSIDDVLVLPYALDAAAIEDLVQRDILPPALPEPVARYSFDDTDNPGKDSGDNGYNLTAVGSVAVADSPVSGGLCVLNGSGYFQYTDDPAACPEKIPADGAARTVTLWVCPDAGGGWWESRTVLYWGDGGGNCYVVDTAGDSAYPNTLLWRFATKNTVNNQDHTTQFKAPSPTIQSGSDGTRWHHLAVTTSHGGNRFYVDGVLVAKDTTGANTVPRGYFCIGSRNSTRNFKGKIDEVRIYDVALSDAQIRQVMLDDVGADANVLPPDAPLAVAAGARVDVVGAEQTVTNLTGAGEVHLRDGGLTLAGTTDFTGTVNGSGSVTFAHGGTLSLSATGPLVSVAGPVTFGPDCRVAWTSPDAPPRAVTLVQAASIVSPENLSTWTFAAPGRSNLKGTFTLTDNTLTLSIQVKGLVIIVR